MAEDSDEMIWRNDENRKCTCLLRNTGLFTLGSADSEDSFRSTKRAPRHYDYGAHKEDNWTWDIEWINQDKY